MDEQPFKFSHQTEDDWWETRDQLERTAVATKLGAVVAAIAVLLLLIRLIW